MNRPDGRSPWALCRTRRPRAALRLYCFPHSGGSPGEYVRWADDLPEIEVWGVQAPGRGARLHEEAVTDARTLVGRFLDTVEPTAPFALFGHSLGALLAYETARELRRRGLPQPRLMFLSACPPPDHPREQPRISDLPDAALLDVVQRRYGGLPEALTRDPALLGLVLPAHRADFAVLENHRHVPEAPLEVPLVVVGGDRDIPREVLAGWQRHTTGRFDLHVLPGGHFYLRDEAQHRALMSLISRAADGAPAPAAAALSLPRLP
ncbi:thioesterase II family protein [Streptomyces sp. NBC_00096]|uniref:thioesterase II family protein n=1 Tax=Streptomyces sp. NBC_00096 TaxID=2975650 RepID=UPI00324723D3